MNKHIHECMYDKRTFCTMDLPCQNCNYYLELTATVEEMNLPQEDNYCNHTGYYNYVKFLFFKRKFLSCEICGRLIPKTRWMLDL